MSDPRERGDTGFDWGDAAARLREKLKAKWSADLELQGGVPYVRMASDAGAALAAFDPKEVQLAAALLSARLREALTLLDEIDTRFYDEDYDPTAAIRAFRRAALAEIGRQP